MCAGDDVPSWVEKRVFSHRVNVFEVWYLSPKKNSTLSHPKDDAFLAEAKKRSAIITPGTGEELEAILAEQMGSSEKLIAAVRAAIDTSGAKSVKK